MRSGIIFILSIYFALLESNGLHGKFLSAEESTSPNTRHGNASSFAISEKIKPIVERPLLIGSFNIQTLGSKKFSRPDIMTTIGKVILRYDVILIMEIITTQADFYMKKLLYDLNRLSTDGLYSVTLSDSHPQNNEMCAFIYRIDKVKVISSEMFSDVHNLFYRKPFIVRFKALTLRDMSEFIAVGLHVKPSQAVQEISALAKVYDDARGKYHIEDILFMGDFNADCDYVKEGDWNTIDLWTRSEFTWPLTHSADTTTNHKSCALDRFVFAGYNMDKGVIVSTAKTFNFQNAFGLTTAEARAVSDHWPIEIQIRGKMSVEAEAHLYSSICVAVADLRKSNFSSTTALSGKAKSAGFTYSRDQQQNITLSKNTKTEADALKALSALYNIAPEIVSNEQYQAIIYKLKHSSLEDKSSLADLEESKFFIRVVNQNRLNTVSVCRKTTVN